MKTVRSIMILMALGFAVHLQAQTPPQQRRVVKEPYQGGWSVQPEPSAPPAAEERIERSEVKKDEASADADALLLFDRLRQERVNALARQQGILSEGDRKAYGEKAEQIERSAPNSFEAHMARFYAEFPSIASFQYLDRAFMRDPARDELIGPKLADALRRNHSLELTQWARKMRDRGQIPAGLYQFTDDLLNSVEKNGVLITAGEMDTYPILTRQFADGDRRDVFVIDQRLLVDPAYRQRIWERTRAKGKVPSSADGFIAALANSTDRQLFLSPALGRDRIGLPREKLYVVGLALQYSDRDINNIPQLEQRWKQMSKTAEAGPLSKNYLLPGVVLLKHYRETEDEAGAVRIEAELRALAKKLNATQELYRTGYIH